MWYVYFPLPFPVYSTSPSFLLGVSSIYMCAFNFCNVVLVFCYIPVFLQFLLSWQPLSKLSAALIHNPYSFLFLVSFISWVLTILSLGEEMSVSFPLSHTYAHLLVLSSCSHSVTLILTTLWQDFSCRCSFIPRLSPFLSKVLACTSLSASCKITSNIIKFFFPYVFFLSSLSLPTGIFPCHMQFSSQQHTFIASLWLVSLQKGLSFYSIIIITPDYKAYSFKICCLCFSQFCLFLNTFI